MLETNPRRQTGEGLTIREAGVKTIFMHLNTVMLIQDSRKSETSVNNVASIFW